jgi:hypothetical protein
MLLVPLLGIAACQVIDDARYKPNVGPLVPDAQTVTGVCPIVPGDPCGDSNPLVDVSFSRDVAPLINRATPGGCMVHTMMPTLPNVLLDTSTYTSLRRGGYFSKQKIIIDCKPCDSILVQKLQDPAPFGARMPMDGHYWSDVDMTLLRDWIAEGARDN